jgi:hypothetical protein
MRLFLIFFLSISSPFVKAQGVLNPASTLTEIDFNYLNKGIWELSTNGYLPREDLKLINLYGNKQQSSDWYFMCHKICKSGIDLGYVITGKINSASAIVHNLFFLKQNSVIATNHNQNKIENLKTLGVLPMFMFRATTIEKYNLDSECPK